MTAPKKWDPDPADHALAATLRRSGKRIVVDLVAKNVVHEAGGVLRASNAYKGDDLLKVLNQSQHKTILDMARDQEQERQAVAAGRTVWAGTVKAGTK